MHLVRRFFGHLRATPLSPAEQDQVRSALSPSLAALFFRQAPPDQRHALQVAERLRAVRPDDHEALTAALIHDVGKSASNVGAIGRSLATVCDAIGLPMTPRWRRYRDHGAIGAAALETAGAPELAVAFARYHPGPSPDGVDPAAWAALGSADAV